METDTAPARESKYILGLFLLLLVVAGGVLYWLMFRREYLPTQFFKLDESIPEEAGVEYDRVFRNPPAVKVTDFNPDRSDASLTQILQGYFYTYDADAQTLQVLNRLRSDYLQQLEVSLDQVVGFYCWPETIEGPDGPIETKSMRVVTYPDGRDVYMPGEKFVKLELLRDFVSLERYMIIQLDQPFQLGADNLVQKLILVGC